MQRAGTAIRSACFNAIQDGIRTADLGGKSGTVEFADEVVARASGLLSL